MVVHWMQVKAPKGQNNECQNTENQNTKNQNTEGPKHRMTKTPTNKLIRC